MFLATTALTEFWDTSDEILLVGPWCLRYDRKAEWENLRYSVLPSPWKDPGAVRDAEDYCSKVIDSLVIDLAMRLNWVHGVKYSQRYWRIILGPWLLHYVHCLYDRYISLRHAWKLYGRLNTVVLNPSSYKTPVDTLDFPRLAQNESADLFNLQICSQILRTVGYNEIILKEVNPPPEGRGERANPEDPYRTAWPLRRLVRWVAELALFRMTQPRVMLGGVGLNRRDLFRLVRAMAFRGWAAPLPQTIRCEVRDRNETMRGYLSDIPVTDEFTSVVIRTLSLNLPLVYLEGYADFRKACLKMWPYPPKVLVSSDWYYNEVFKLLAAEFGERGSRLVSVQHGGGYGTSKVLPQERHELSITDRFLSFGWSDGQGNRIVRPLPHPRFLPLATQDGQCGTASKDIVLVTTSHPRYPFRFESYPVGQFDVVLEWRRRFIQKLLPLHRAQLVVRLHPQDFGWCQEQRLVETCGPLRFCSTRSSISQLLGEIRLVVIEYHGTTFLEMLAANVPTILFWDPQHWEVRDEAAPYFEDLRKVGILWDSPEAAAAKVAEIYDDPSTWWQSEAAQEVRQRFVDRYALGRADWVDCWVKVLREEMALAREDGRGIV